MDTPSLVMSKDINNYFEGLLKKIHGLYIIQITDRDGAPVMRVSQDKNVDFTLTSSFISTFTTASDQAGKLGLGRNKTIISMYSNYQVKLPYIQLKFLSKHLTHWPIIIKKTFWKKPAEYMPKLFLSVLPPNPLVLLDSGGSSGEHSLLIGCHMDLGEFVVVQMNKLPLILTFVGSENCNTGHILALEHQLDAYLEDMRLAVSES